MKNYGVKINIGDHISRNIINYLYSGDYEGREILILKKELESGDKVLEIGSGLGYLTIFCSKTIGSGNVITYEANPLLIDKIEDNFRLNNEYPKLCNAILGDEEAESDFYVEEEFWSSSIVKRSDSASRLRVKNEEINRIIINNKINFIIMDIEGGEKDLIYKIDYKGLNKLLIEIHPHVIGNYESTKIIAHLFQQGFIIDFNISSNDVILFSKSANNLAI